MKSIFAQSREIVVGNTFCVENLAQLPEVIGKHTQFEYVCKKTETGILLRPTFRNMPHRNSFVPEIDVVVFKQDTQTVLQLCGQPVVWVRVLSACFSSFVTMMGISVLVIALTSGLESMIPVFIPPAMLVFNYLLCKIGTKVTFQSILKGIEKEWKA